MSEKRKKNRKEFAVYLFSVRHTLMSKKEEKTTTITHCYAILRHTKITESHQ